MNLFPNGSHYNAQFLEPEQTFEVGQKVNCQGYAATIERFNTERGLVVIRVIHSGREAWVEPRTLRAF